MLSADLLRVTISKGRISPVFCSVEGETDCEIASKLVEYFVEAQKDGRSKGVLLERAGLLESGYDYKLVRGLFALLERRSVFARPRFASIASPAVIRKELFAESSRRGLALSDLQRRGIIQKIADRMHVLYHEIEEMMWSDLDDNLILSQFDVIGIRDLLLWYNLSLAQTLLFRCTGLEFYVGGGLHWKHVLRNVKRYGLMYSLKHGVSGDDSITCSLDGPLSLFKMTDRYGTSMAKLLPSIVGTPFWWIKGSIMRRNTDGGQKIYRFELSSKETKEFFRQSVANADAAALQKNNGGGVHTTALGGVVTIRDDMHVYDSLLEAEFAKRFCQHFDQNDRLGWKIYREPDPLIAEGKAMIPDFLFERFGRKVYLEIVGFWTKEYIQRKAVKLKALLEDDGEDSTVDLMVAVNSELVCSSSSQIEAISSDKIFTFKKDVPIKPVLEHLKEIDAEIVREKIDSTIITLDDQNNLDLISVTEMADRYCIPDDAVFPILNEGYPGRYAVIGSYLISKSRTDAINRSLDGATKFVEACKVMTLHGVYESCHADLLSVMGYDVVWGDLDPANARIVKNA